MQTTSPTNWLKQGPHRRLGILEAEDGQHHAVKSFRARGWMRRLRDRRRAENEFRVLGKLHAAGLQVPRPIKVQRSGGAWELHSTWINGAQSLSSRLEFESARDGTEKTPAFRASRLARALGRLVGRAHALGLNHGDLHAGNVLVDEDEQTWLLDFTQSTFDPALPLDQMMIDLVNLGADAREFTSPGLRKRFLLAWWRELRQGRSQNLRSLVAPLEDRIRSRRQAALLEHQDRWLRPSGLCQAQRIADGELLVAQSQSSCFAQHESWLTEVLLDPSQQGFVERDDVFLYLDRDERQLEVAWLDMGRAAQHQIPAPRPLALRRQGSPVAVYRVDGPLIERSTRKLREPQHLRALGSLHGIFHDRGLHMAGSAPLWWSQDDVCMLSLKHRLRTGSRQPTAPPAEHAQAYVEAFLQEWRAGSLGLAALRAQLQHG